MSILPRKTHMLWVEEEPQECIWCKQKRGITELTLEHVNGREIKPNLRIIKLACKKCNSIHGAIMGHFVDMINGKIKMGHYLRIIRSLALKKDNFFKIINNGWFQVSLDRFRTHPRFRHNPTKLTYTEYSSLVMNKVIGQSCTDEFTTDVFFAKKVKSKGFMWRVSYALS